MTPRLQDLDNSQTFYARLYEAGSAWDEDRYIADEVRIPQKRSSLKELALSFGSYLPTTAKMDWKLI